MPKPPKLLDDEATLRRIYGKNYYGARRHTGPSADGAGQKYLPVHVALVKSVYLGNFNARNIRNFTFYVSLT